MLRRARAVLGRQRPLTILIGIALLALLFGLPLCRRGIILSDEGYLLLQSLDLLEGRVLYRDMDSFVTPGAWFLLAGLFGLVGPSVIASRMLVLVAYAALAVVGYRIVEPLSSRLTGLVTFAALLLFSVWAFPAWTFAFYSPFSVLLALIGLERLLCWHRRGARRDLLLAGLSLGLSICFKQNYGVFALAGCGLGHLAMQIEARRPLGETLRRATSEAGLVAAGVALAGLPFLVYLLANGALGDAWRSLVVHPFEFAGRHDIPYAPISALWRPDLYTEAVERLTYLAFPMLRAAPIAWLLPLRVVHRLHVLLYWIPPLVFAAGLALAWIRREGDRARIDAALFCVIATCALLFLGVLPRADFNHLVNVYQPVLVAAPLVVARILGRLPARRRIARALALGLPLTVLGAYGSISLYWYASLVDQLDSRVGGSRGGVLVSSFEARKIDEQLRIIDQVTQPGDFLLTVPDLAMLNFLSARAMPSAYYNLYEHHIAKDRGAAVVAGAETHHVQLAVTRYDNFFSDRVGLLEYAPLLSEYLITHFERMLIGGDEEFVAYRRRSEVLEQHPFESVLADCDVGPDAGWNVELRQHLLFSALYHRSRPGNEIPSEGIETVCHVQVSPSGGFLTAEVGYRQPLRAQRGTHLRSEIWAEGAEGRELLFSRRFRVVQRQGSAPQPRYPRVEVDLSRWAGERIELLFRSELQGAVLGHPLDFKGFAAVYRDVRVQTQPGGAHP